MNGLTAHPRERSVRVTSSLLAALVLGALGALSAEPAFAQAPPATPEPAPEPNPSSSPTPPPAETPPAAAPPPVTPPHLVYAEDPTYPTSQLAGGTHPSVVFQVVIDRDGSVRSAEVEHSAGEDFDRAASEALAHWRFEPARRGDTPIASRVRVAVHFELPHFDVPTTEAHAHDVVEVEEQALPEARHDVHDPAREAAEVAESGPESTAPTGDDEVVARVVRIAPAFSTVPATRTASDFQLDRATLDLAPRRDAGQMLEAAPGVVVTRPEGDGVAHRILLRGFDAEHGQNIELTLQGIPLNQPSHLHGQGYTDLSILMPELVQSIRVTEGVYDPRQGDFAVAGSADFRLGAERTGTTLVSQAGSFGTFRQAVVVAGEDENRASFIGMHVRRTAGYGPRRAGFTAGTMGQLTFGSGGWAFRLLGAFAANRTEIGGVVRRDDIGRIGFYGTYPDATARAQSVFGARALVALLGESRGRGEALTRFSSYVGFSDFRLASNFTGYVESSASDPSLRGLGDLVDQRNQAGNLGVQMAHRTGVIGPEGATHAQLEVGASARLDRIRQSQSLIAAPSNEEWDRRIDASIVGLDLGFWGDADIAFGSLVSLRGGLRADALYYDVDDHLAGVAGTTTGTSLLGNRRAAYGLAVGPRASLEVHPDVGPTFHFAYGEGYRSPQAITLRDGQRAAYTKVRSADVGLRYERTHGDTRFALSGASFLTYVASDSVFEPSEGMFESVGATRRTGGVIAAELDAWDTLRARASFTGAKAVLLEAPAPSDEDPSPAYHTGQLVPFVAPIVVRADVGAEHDLGRLGGHAVHGSIGFGLSYVGRRPMPYSTWSPAFTLLDAQASVSYRAIELGVSAQNLIGSRYAAAEQYFVSNWDPSATPSRTPTSSIQAGAPRTLLFTLEIRP